MAIKSTTANGLAAEVARLSHDSRKLLNVILGYTELMLDEVPGRINAAQRRSLEDIHQSGQRLLALLEAAGER